MRSLTAKAFVFLAVTILVAACGGNPPASVSAPSATAAGPSGQATPSAAATTGPAPSTSGGPTLQPGATPAPGSVAVTAIAAGGRHTCALLQGGSVMCWGTNSDGQLGNGSKTGAEIPPVDVVGLSSGVTAIAAAGQYACAVTAAGGVKCWGRNIFGQLGVGTLPDSSTPVDVTGLTSGVVGVSAGDNHACAVTTAGAVKCWGWNDAGQLGDGTTTNSSVPVDVTGLSSGVVSVAASGGELNREGGFSCAVLTTGAVKCWGGNGNGQLGNGTKTGSQVPVDVAGLTGVSQVAAGSGMACALTTAGGVKCWGGATVVATDVPNLTSGVGAIAARFDRRQGACAVTDAGAVSCWDDRNPTPVADAALTGDVRTIVLGAQPCVLDAAGVVRCLSSNTGVGYAAIAGLTPSTAGPGPGSSGGPTSGGTIAISAGRDTTCAVSSAGGAVCWGLNNFGQLGSGATALSSSTPVAVVGLASGVKSVAASDGYACALTEAGGVKCWGHNDRGQLGNGSTVDSLVPVDVTGLGSGVSAIGAGAYAACAVIGGGGVSCWGTNSNTPAVVAGLTGVTSVAVGTGFACALTASGGVKCWGGNIDGQLGNGSTNNSFDKAVDVTGLSGASGVSTGLATGCAVTASGGVKCWGDNHGGQLGVTPVQQPLFLKSATPVDVPGRTSGVTRIAVGGTNACLVTSAGGAVCWGIGLLGNGASADQQRPDPVEVSGLATGVQTIVVGTSHICALTTTGLVKCWGNNSTGALGVDPSAGLTQATTPVDVVGLK